MEITFDVIASDNHFVTQVGPIKLNATEQARLTALGPFLVNFGGNFNDGEDLDFDLPVKQVRVPNELPQKVSFSIEALTAQEAAARANFYKTEILARIQSALNTWSSFDITAQENKTVVTITAS